MIVKSTNRSYRLNKHTMREKATAPYVLERRDLKRAIRNTENVPFSIAWYHGTQESQGGASLGVFKIGRRVTQITIGCQRFLDGEAQKLYRWATARA